MTTTIQLPIRNVSCDACEKVIGRLLRRFDQAKIESISKDATTLTLTCEEKELPGIKAKLSEYNYLNETTPRAHPSFVLHRIVQGHAAYRREHELLTQTLLLFATLFIGMGFAFLLWGQSERFTILFPILALLPMGIAVNAGALQHVRQLVHHLNCANGMMAGMIIGMIAGFMSGAVIGATNGMFMGSIVGMGIGMGASAYAVRKVGIMGILEGLMAGLMAGTMGAMLSVMMLTDHLIVFLYILFAVCIFILLGMSYFMLKEVGPIQDEGKETPLLPLATLGLLVLLGFMLLALFGPQSLIAFGVVA
ncbi:MAG: hypothetical protein IPJ89_02535 [Candidatus Iainarchaeum archaeon]|uniref:HMA domain-containing protein n=1 Tax=Candidatus Iainarchaeum sp. TaxID=3101447 RepID=A0A7T9DKR0_9ARCH|nr:MAG: hypothetical protein IPJ89_02535 [Candidatus Diapherotrites archaeon]